MVGVNFQQVNSDSLSHLACEPRPHTLFTCPTNFTPGTSFTLGACRRRTSRLARSRHDGIRELGRVTPKGIGGLKLVSRRWRNSVNVMG
jgi:hypothetical protein